MIKVKIFSLIVQLSFNFPRICTSWIFKNDWIRLFHLAPLPSKLSNVNSEELQNRITLLLNHRVVKSAASSTTKFQDSWIWINWINFDHSFVHLLLLQRNVCLTISFSWHLYTNSTATQSCKLQSNENLKLPCRIIIMYLSCKFRTKLFKITRFHSQNFCWWNNFHDFFTNFWIFLHHAGGLQSQQIVPQVPWSDSLQKQLDRRRNKIV